MRASSRLQPVETAALQPDIEENEVWAACDYGTERIIAVLRGTRAVAFVLQDARDQFADIRFIVDNEDV